MNGYNGGVNPPEAAGSQELQDSLNEIGRLARRQADDAKREAVKGLNSAAMTLRREAREAGASREVQESVNQIAHGLEKTAAYLHQHSYEDMSEDVERAVKVNPLRSVGIAFAGGLLLGLLLRSGGRR